MINLTAGVSTGAGVGSVLGSVGAGVVGAGVVGVGVAGEVVTGVVGVAFAVGVWVGVGVAVGVPVGVAVVVGVGVDVGVGVVDGDDVGSVGWVVPGFVPDAACEAILAAVNPLGMTTAA